MIRMHVFQHVAFEGVGYVEKYCRERGIKLSYTRVFAKDAYPAEGDYDCLLVMGGPMSVYEEKIHPWIAIEKRCIVEAVCAQKKVLGICLGAQLLASALGARVYPNTHKEIGWFPVDLTAFAQTQNLFKTIAGQFMAFHWHGDTFDIPDGAIHCASSAGCKNQAFVYNDLAIGLQFHCEMTEGGIQRLIDNCGYEIREGRFIQGREEIASAVNGIAASNEIMKQLLDNLLSVGGT
jgi:GMP synthase-like glutamine amidotransferase